MMRTLISLPLAALTLAAADPSSPELVLARMQKAQSSVESLTARLEQVKSYPQIGIEDPPERGTFTMARTKRGTTRVRMEIQEPETRILTVADGKYLLYQPRIKQAVEGKVSGGGKKGLFFRESSPDRQKRSKSSSGIIASSAWGRRLCRRRTSSSSGSPLERTRWFIASRSICGWIRRRGFPCSRAVTRRTRASSRLPSGT